MTCVVALEDNGSIWMGADSASYREDEVLIRQDEKVFKNGEFLIGFSGSFRIGQLLRWSLRPPKFLNNKAHMEYLVCDFVECLRNLLDTKGVLFKEETGDAHDSEIVLGFKGNIYVIEADFNVSSLRQKFAVSGSGFAYALGAMNVLYHDISLTPKQKIERALAVAGEYSPSVKSPFVVLNQD